MRLTTPIPTLRTLAAPRSDADGELTLEQVEPELEIDCTYRPGDPGCRTLPNGDPGYPPEAPEVEIHSITSRAPLLWVGRGLALAATAGADLTELLSATDFADLEERIVELAEQARRDAEGEARIAQAEDPF